MTGRPPGAGGLAGGSKVGSERSGRCRTANERPGGRRILPGLLFFVSWVLSAAPAGAVVPAVRRILVVDSDAEVFGSITDRRGAVFILGYDFPELRVATTGAGFVDPIAVASRPDRLLYVLDTSADPLNLGSSSGVVWLADPAASATAAPRLAGASALFRAPADIVLDPQTGDLLISDRDSDPSGWGRQNGCVYRIDPRSNSVSIVAAPSVFSEPIGLTWDLDGSLLVVDRTANPQGLSDPAGALFRVNPRTGSVALVRAFSRSGGFVRPAAVAVIDQGPTRGDYLLVDSDADPFDRGDRPGAVYRLPADGSPPTFFCAAIDFREPIDLLVGVREDVLVLDKLAETANNPLGVGAIFRFRLSDGTVMQSPWGSNSFRNLSGFMQLAGAEIDSSRVRWTDENGGQTSPGDIFTLRARIVNSGTADAASVTLSDTLRSPFSFVAGSDSFQTGAGAYDPRSSSYEWKGSLARGDSAVVRLRIRLDDDAQSGGRYTQRVTLRADGTPASFLRPIIPFRDFVSGVTAFADVVPLQGTDTGFLYLVGADSLAPALLWRGGLLRRPSDLVFLDDGRMAILDPSSPAGELGGVFVYSASAQDTVGLLRALRLEDGLRSPAGITLDRDGNLLLVDRNANPNQWPYQPNPLIGDSGPGALYRLDVQTKELSLVAAPSTWREPIDAVVDRKGLIVVVDYEGGSERQGALWEIGAVPGGREIPLDSRFFRDPSSVACDLLNDIFVCDPTFGGGSNPNGGCVLRVRRGNAIGYSIASSNPMLRRPVDCAVSPDGRLYIADRDANPHGLPDGDRGAIFVLNPANARLEVAAATGFLRQPDGVACVGTSDLFASRLSLVVPGGSDPRPGDTLRVDVRLINRGLASVPQGVATLTLSSTLAVVADAAAPPGVAYDEANQRISWTGRIAFGDTVAYSARVRVLSGASYGTPAEVSLTIQGGRFPVQLRAVRPIRSSFTPNDILLVDSSANPQGLPDSVGAVFRLGAAADQPVRLVYSSLSLRHPSALEWSGLGDLLLAASRGSDPGQIYRFNTSSGGLVLLTTAADSSLKSPSDLLLSRQGDLFVVDPDARGPVPEARGAVFRKSLSTSPLTLFASDPRFRSPRQIAYGPDGRLYLADPEADPDLLGGNPGAVFILSESTGEVVDWLQNPNMMPDPVGVAPYDDSTLVITDQRGSAGLGTLLLYRPFRDLLFPLVQLNDFRSIWRTTRLPSGELLVLDRNSGGTDQPGRGLVHGFDPVLRRLRTYARCDSFRAITDIVPKPGPVVRIARYEAEDLNGPPLHPADKLRVRAVLRNIGSSLAATVSYTDSVPLGCSLLAESAFASSGRIEADGRRALWTGAILAADSVQISYEVQLNPALVEGRLLTLTARAYEPAVGTLTQQLDLEAHVPLEPGHLYLIDSGANPYGRAGQTGALFKVDLVTGSVVPMLASSQFRKPVSIALVGNQASPKFLILDTFARNPLGRIGTLFLFDPATREMRNLGAHSSWLAPAKVLAWTDEEALLLDSSADPFDLIPGNSAGPGALYRVVLESGEITPVFSDTTLKVPTGLAWWEPGLLAISDIKADPARYGNENGAIYTLDMGTMRLAFLASSQLWRTPRAIASRVGGGLLVADRDATPYDAGGGYGSVHSVNANGQAVLLTVSPLFAYLNDIQSEVNGNPIVADANVDPFRFGVRPGAILRWRSTVNGRFLPLSSSPLFREPEGFVLFGGLVPVAVTEASIQTLEEGIELSWRGSNEATGARFLVYRREADGPDDPGDADASRSELVSGESEFVGPGPHRFLDREVESGRWYAYLIVGIDSDGSVTYATPLLARAPEGVARLALSRPSPNPFRPGRALRFAVPPSGGAVRLAVYDVGGRQVRRLVDGPVAPGRHAVTWDGRDDAGLQVASGVYFVRLSRGDEVRRVRLVLLR